MSKFLILNVERTAGWKTVMWWKSNAHGYTANADEAGIYTAVQADEIANGRDDIAIALDGPRCRLCRAVMDGTGKRCIAGHVQLPPDVAYLIDVDEQDEYLLAGLQLSTGQRVSALVPYGIAHALARQIITDDHIKQVLATYANLEGAIKTLRKANEKLRAENDELRHRRGLRHG